MFLLFCAGTPQVQVPWKSAEICHHESLWSWIGTALVSSWLLRVVQLAAAPKAAAGYVSILPNSCIPAVFHKLQLAVAVHGCGIGQDQQISIVGVLRFSVLILSHRPGPSGQLDLHRSAVTALVIQK